MVSVQARIHFQNQLAKSLVSDWKVVNFRPLSSIEFPYLPQEVIQNLSSDQFYAHQICRAVI